MSMGTAVYRLPLSKLQALESARIVTDADLADLRPHSYRVDQGLAYPMRDYPDLFAYILKPEGRIAQQHEEISVGYITPAKLRERLREFEQLDPASIEEDIPERELPRGGYLERQMKEFGQFARETVDQGLALLIVHVY
jgi:hypothetical protein